MILRLAEYSNGDCTEAQLQDLLRLLVATPVPSPAVAYAGEKVSGRDPLPSDCRTNTISINYDDERA